jgi:hypothetical protein
MGDGGVTYQARQIKRRRRPDDEIRFLKGRLKFGDETNSAPFPSAVIVMRSTTKMLSAQMAIPGL